MGQKELSAEDMRQHIEEEIFYKRIFVTDLARELSRSRQTIYLWLWNMTPQRYEAMLQAIDRIMDRRI